MSDTTNSSADPWGLPDDDTIPAPVEPAKESVAPETVEDDEVETFQSPPAEPEDESEADSEPVETFETLPVEPEVETWAEEAQLEPDADEPQESPPADPASRGPLSQVLAASGFFGGSPVPPADEPDAEEEPAEPEEAAESMAPVETSIDVGALETVAEDPGTVPPDLTLPTSGAILGLGGTDADLPPEPPPWMVTEPVVGEPGEPAGDGLEDVFEDIAPATEAAIEEAAAGFAEVSIVEEDAETATFEDLPQVEDEVGSEPDAELESLVAELTDTALEIEEDTGSEEVDTDITIDPADTPSVFRELEDLPGSEQAVRDSPVDEATVSFEEVVDQIEDADAEDAHEKGDVIDDAARSSAEWGLFESTDEPSIPDTPVFGVTFGKDDDGEDAPPVVEDAEAEPVDDQVEESDIHLADSAPGLPDDTPEIEDTIEPVTLDESTGDLADFAAILPDTPEIDEVISDDSAEFPSGSDVAETSDFSDVLEDIESADHAAGAPDAVEVETPESASPDDGIAETISEPEPDDGVPIEWGSRWQESAQGWVEDGRGRSTWRPIVTTSPLLSEWQIDTYLGVVSADVVLGSGSIESEMATGRTSAMRNLVDEAMARGAHAIVGVSTTMAPVGSATVLTATGTAVTLKAQD